MNSFEQECQLRKDWLLGKLEDGFFTLEEIRAMLVAEFEDEIIDPQATIAEVLGEWVEDDEIVLIGGKYSAR